MMTFPQSVMVFIASVVVGASAFGAFVIFFTPQTPVAPAAVVLYPTPTNLSPNAIEAKAAIVFDPRTQQILFAKNTESSLPLASLTKLMTAFAVLKSQDPQRLVTITLQDLAPEGDWGLKDGDVMSLKDLLTFGLVASSNDAMAAAAATLGSEYVQEMNRAAGSLGLTHTYFLNPTGLDLDTETSGSYGSAHDVATLASAFLASYPEYFQLSTTEKVSVVASGRTLTAKATDTPLFSIPGFIGAKTGYTDLAGGNLVAAFDLEPGHPVVVVVLGSTQTGRFSDVRTLIEATRLSAQAGAAQTP